MSEWASVIAVFWTLWVLDGARWGKRRGFTFVGGARGRGRVGYSRASLPGVRPTGWRFAVADVPLSISPQGIANAPLGSAGRPAEAPASVQAWRWDEVRQVGIAHGALFVNGARFCADTGHVSARELLALAQLPAAARERRIRAIVRRWFRPAHLRRRARVLCARTRAVAALNAVLFAASVALSAYVLGDLAEKLPPRASRAIAEVLPWFLLGVLAAHGTAVVLAWRGLRRLRAVVGEKRGAALFSAALLPPQAMRLRALLGDGFFPPQHPLAGVLAFAGARERASWAFNAIADLRWPLPPRGAESPLAREITAWFRRELEPQVAHLLAGAGIATDGLLAPPPRDAPESRAYCPRCRDQFVVGARVCPHGVALLPLPETAPAAKSR